MNTMNDYNKFETLRYIPDAILNYLIYNNEIIWKLFKYQEPNALDKPNLTIKEKTDLIYNGYYFDGGLWKLEESKDKSIFKQPFLDDANIEQQTMLRLFLSTILPENRSIATAYYTVELMCHMKSISIISNLGNNNNEKIVTTENRIELLTQQILKTLNGAEVGSVGRIFFDMEGGYMTKANLGLYNNRNYCGMRLILGCKVSNA